MYADTLMDLERGHLLRLGMWAVLSVIVGALLLALVYWRKSNTSFLRHFAIQTLAWGVLDSAIVVWAWRGLEYRDYAHAMQLQKFLWLNVGLDGGYVGIGITLAIAGWMLGKRLGVLGAGVGVVVQGFALFVLDLRLLTVIDGARIALMTSPVHTWLFG
ncbi:MAG: hypothetical protein ABI852_14560 [Gemmatimonadaceae bacterium]